MGKFDGYLICTDLDDTLLTTDKKVSDENVRAIHRFMDEGGLFTFATGRVPAGVKNVIDYIRPNAPIVCFNGGAVYDLDKKQYLWQSKLKRGAGAIIDYIEKQYDFVGTEVITIDKFYFHKINARVLEHETFEHITGIRKNWHGVPEPWMKVIFMQEENEVDLVRRAIAQTDYDKSYNFVQSSPYYYEILPKDATKGDAALKICDILGIKKKKTIGIGDNENDISLLQKLGIGAAVLNASDEVKKHADIIAPHHNNNAIAGLINEIEKKVI